MVSCGLIQYTNEWMNIFIRHILFVRPIIHADVQRRTLLHSANSDLIKWRLYVTCLKALLRWGRRQLTPILGLAPNVTKTLFDELEASERRSVLWPLKYAEMHFRPGRRPRTPLGELTMLPRRLSRLGRGHRSPYLTHSAHSAPRFGGGMAPNILCRTTPRYTMLEITVGFVSVLLMILATELGYCRNVSSVVCL